MLAALEALDALGKFGTMRAAGTYLRVTQSAVSKRIAALETATDSVLIERRGRLVALTPAARTLLERAGPALAELRVALGEAAPANAAFDRLKGGASGLAPSFQLSCGVSESILGSWGAAALREATAAVPGLTLALHAHRSPTVVDRVAAGEYALGLIAGAPGNLGTDVDVAELWREPMVLVPSGLAAAGLLRARPLAVITIEIRSGTWESIARACRQAGIEPERRLESFFAVAQLAAQGFGHGLVPLGVAQALGLTAVAGVRGLTRPVQLIGRATTMARPATRQLLAALRAYRPFKPG